MELNAGFGASLEELSWRGPGGCDKALAQNMPPKRKRNASLSPKGFAAGDQLKRNALPRPSTSDPWGWVVSEVSDAAGITQEHSISACNLAARNKNTSCRNKYSTITVKKDAGTPKATPPSSTAAGELEDDIIVISDDDEPSCPKKECKANPMCLNYLGQDLWEDEEQAEEEFMKSANLGKDPSRNSREPGLPVGLKNLGATCYANASLQVWYRDLAFRSGVYSWKPPDNIPVERYKAGPPSDLMKLQGYDILGQDSPIFQLQVTFAALQGGNKSAFNPTKLVESLQLRASEQQDAQEFSKLFMTHLDAEFKKQASPSVKSLIEDQFQGSQAYGTICHACKNRSERSFDFLEIEVAFENNAMLEDCISTSLLPETLSGDNQYFCSRCEVLQDATRYTELRQLPPVLHFSLLRFVYDISTMERKKSKHSISFPLVLDMNKFLGLRHNRESGGSTDGSDSMYELRGILLHKGASAYHGHYEAQVNDNENGTWFQFNDETVTKIQALGDNKVARKKASDESHEKAEGDDERPSTSQMQKKRANARKRKRIEDSDDEIEVVGAKRKASSIPSPKPAEGPNPITSKDAYMLIYAKRNYDSSKTLLYPKPPDRALKIVQGLNEAHTEACRMFEEKKGSLKAHFQKLRQTVRSIYSCWSTPSTKDCIVASRQALEAWLSNACIEATLRHSGVTSPADAPSQGSSEESTSVTISLDDITCEHGMLDPLKAKDMKCITPAAYVQLVKETNCIFDTVLRPSDACTECVSMLFMEKLYEIEHPRHAKKFDEISVVPEDGVGYWLSKKWCRDWRLIKPRMHEPFRNDPAPDSEEFRSHVFCEHGGLSLSTTGRRKISAEAVTLLRKLFPTWTPLSSDTEPCAVCEAEIHVSKEDKREVRRRIEDEKARLRFIYEPTLDTWAVDRSTRTQCAIVPSQFIKKWKRWLNSPDNARPESIDNSSFLCKHGLLLLDPNCSTDLDSSVIVIQREDWDTLLSIYSGGPLIALTKLPSGDERVYDHDVPVCAECRLKRRTEWDTADVVIRLFNGNGNTNAVKKPLGGYGLTNGSRQSKRLRQAHEHGKRRILTVSKTSTIKEIKVMINEEFSIPTICQRLFYKEKELEDNSATVEELGLFANDILDLREVVEINSDSDETPANKRRREEGPGFGGTLLGNADSCWSSSPEQTPAPHFSNQEKACRACTFSNTFDALSCQMCDTNFV
ncbi:unnamed protein product [Cyclocybe aegerita]|uniref:ubiquitinyl hydrolase 1 n=1 Tax=Cyclocybe aegerita TaxID=1973307 RepID=A0A8S0W5Q9_CYCAE|nr:unnamed protein product [Cyclocybe aegerita]